MRQNITPDPESRLFEAYMSFAGGHNSEISNDRLRDDEFVVQENIELSGRGSAKRRTGRLEFVGGLPNNAQGHFLFYRVGADKPDHIFAANGRLYLGTSSVPTNISITDGANTNWAFQAVNMIEAVQYGTTLFVATGTKLVEVSCDALGVFTAKTVVPYTPSVQEVIYIGTNALAPNPAGYVQDSVTSTLTVAGISPQYRSGAVNMALPFTAYIGKPATITSVDYKWEYKLSGTTATSGTAEVGQLVITAGATANGSITVTLDGLAFTIANMTAGMTTSAVANAIRVTSYAGWITGGTASTVTFTATTVGVRSDLQFSGGTTGITGTPTTVIQGVASNWSLGRDWTQDTAGGKTFDLNVSTVGTYDVQVTIRDHAVLTTTAVGNITGYRVEGTLNKENNTQDVSGIQTCRNIRLHWDRVLLYGDVKNPFLMYISDLKNPRYIPTTNVLSFDTGKLEPVNSVIRFQDYLVVMTTTTIQTLIGKDPSSYGRFLIHDSVGCIAPYSAAVVGNQIIFLSYSGITALRPNPYRIEAMSVKRMDVQIHSEITSRLTQTNACSVFHDNQYWLCYPDDRVIYRFYHELNVWVRDKSDRLDIIQMTSYGNALYDLTSDGKILVNSEEVWSDDGFIYDMIVDAKLYDLGYAFNYKKLRRLYVLARHFTTDVNISVYLWSDSAVVATPEHGQAVVVNDGEDTEWLVTTEPNMHFYAGTVVGSWVLGVNPLGNVQISVQKLALQGKCRRTKVKFVHSDDSPCEIYGFGYEFKLKKVT